jgi:mono/diheme cytochrome c family protein
MLFIFGMFVSLMSDHVLSYRTVFRAWVAGTLLVCVCGGCRESPPEFDLNQVRAMSLEISLDVPTSAAVEDVAVVVEQLFGTPQSPRWPSAWMNDEAMKNLVSLERLTVAAGGVTSDQANAHTGLYQEHCVICHGISGSGAGPASRYQVPYPRDFRAGVFKWKSTARADKPTRDDLVRLLAAGIPGTPMPSFALVSPSEREALVDYVIYLSVRGEVERELLAAAVVTLDYEDVPPDEELRIRLDESDRASELTEGQEAIEEIVNEVVGSWVNATPSQVAPMIELDGETLSDSVSRGRAIFNGPIANCSGCHGQDGVGGLPSLDYDDWTKDFTTRIGITPDDADAVKPFRKAGALPPRKLDPRQLADGLLRGGNDPETLYRRIEHGIAGTPMPGVEINDAEDSKTGLSPSDVWDLVHFLQTLTK